MPFNGNISIEEYKKQNEYKDLILFILFYLHREGHTKDGLSIIN